VLMATSYIEALEISFRYLFEFLKDPVFLIFILKIINCGYFLVL
jgi:hypothetical protein